MNRFRSSLIVVFVLVFALAAGGGCRKKKKKFFIPTEEPGASSVVGTAGGTVGVNDATSAINGAAVIFPPGAFSEDTSVSIGRWLMDIDPPGGMVQCSEIINVSAGRDPQNSFTIILPYMDENNDGLVDGTRTPEVLLMPYRYEESSSSWVQITKVSQDTAANRVTATSDRLGKFALFGPEINETVQPELASNPSPADGAGGVSITASLGSSSETRQRTICSFPFSITLRHITGALTRST
ncbi:MAG: hypothetical protein ACYS8W_21355 [Planctomycetota bacterium]|jgi:hypothetical protein